MKLRGKMIGMAMAPLILATIITSVLLYFRVSTIMGYQVEKNLLSVALSERDSISFDDGNKFYVDEDGNLWNDKFNITTSTGTEEMIKQETNIVVTVFYGDTRYMSTIRDENNQPVVGTKAGEEVIDRVLHKGENYFSSNVDVLGTSYYGIYIPYYEEDGKEPVGIIFSGMTKEDVTSEIYSITTIVVLFMLGIALAFAVGVYFLANQIARRIRSGVSSLEEIAKGNLSEIIEKSMRQSKDESGEIVRAVQAVQKELIGIVSQIVDNSEKVHSVATQMNESVNETQGNLEQVEYAVTEIAGGASSQADDTQQATEKIVIMGDLIKKTTENVNRLSKNTDVMERDSYEAKKTLQSLEDVNIQVKAAIENIYEQTNNTNESAQKISEAINIITSIAEETNLLALNASIEAARAGEQGKGFAVVASEIQSLAEQSNASAMQIGENISELMKDSETAVATMKQVKNIMLEQNKVVEKTDKKFNEVLNGIETSRKDVGCISDNTKDLDEFREQVIDIVQSLSAVSEEYAASTEETSASVAEVNTRVQQIADNAKSLKEIAGELKECIKTFRL